MIYVAFIGLMPVLLLLCMMIPIAIGEYRNTLDSDVRLRIIMWVPINLLLIAFVICSLIAHSRHM